MSDYLAILGRQPELSLVELESLLGAAAVVPFGSNTAVLSGAIDIDRLGGVIKTGVVIYRGPVAPVEVLPLDWEALRGERAGKLAFGLSYYGARATPRSVLATGLELKKQLKAAGPIRFIAPSAGGILSAAQLHHHRVLENGFELLVVVAGRELIVACTTGFQDIEAYSARDYGRPARSAKVGMLPPKLAQILVNTTHAATVVDPFCGTGVVLQEALLLGRPAIGSDAAALAAFAEQRRWV